MKFVADIIQSIRGMHDILPHETPYWERVESVCRSVAAQYGYREIRFPIVEQTRLFKRSIGDATDIVEKEMYTFEDRNGDSLSLRPEGTAVCARAGIMNGLLYHQQQRLWYMGPMFRHERPQKGRQRQFHQFGIEAFGVSGPDIDVEIILLSKRILDVLGLSKNVTLEINTLGSFVEREQYKIKLVEYLTQHKNKLDGDCVRRLETNPLRILDSKNPDIKSIIEQAPTVMDFIGDESRSHFDKLCALLTENNIDYRINPTLVRGLDYYCLTVFEWMTTHLGAQGTICAGGRYDGLVALLGGQATPAFGFAMGLERIILLLQETEKLQFTPNYYVISDHAEQALLLCEKIRHAYPSLVIEMNVGGGNFGAQFKRADKSGAKFAIILGESEIKNNVVALKNLKTGEQKVISKDEIIAVLNQYAHE